MKLNFDDPPLASVQRFQSHIMDVTQRLQSWLDYLHSTYPTHIGRCRVDSTHVHSVAPQLFRMGRVYVGSYGHGIDCPAAHPEIIDEAFSLFEAIAFGGQAKIGLYGGISSGKSSVLHFFRLLLGPLNWLSGRRYLPQLVHSKFRSAIETSRDIHEAFSEMYGAIDFVREDGKRMAMLHFLHNIEDAFGKPAISPIVSKDAMLRLQGEYAKYGEMIILCDDAHRLAQTEMTPEKLRLGPSVETLARQANRVVLTTMRPEWLPDYPMRPVKSSSDYASTHSWYRGVRTAAKQPKIVSLAEFASRTGFNSQAPEQAFRWADKTGFRAAYFRVGDMNTAHEIGNQLHRSAIETVVCDGRVERTEVSDWAWYMHREGCQFAVISGGSNPRFHRSLPSSVGLFMDLTQDGTVGALRNGLCGSASGYGREGSLVVVSPNNEATIRHNNRMHRGFGRNVVCYGPLKRVPYVADVTPEIDSRECGIDDLLRVIQQQGKLPVQMYRAA